MSTIDANVIAICDLIYRKLLSDRHPLPAEAYQAVDDAIKALTDPGDIKKTAREVISGFLQDTHYPAAGDTVPAAPATEAV